jgi:hypothetical protein
MKKMNKMYEAPKAEMIQVNVDKSFMQTVTPSGSVTEEEGQV